MNSLILKTTLLNTNESKFIAHSSFPQPAGLNWSMGLLLLNSTSCCLCWNNSHHISLGALTVSIVCRWTVDLTRRWRTAVILSTDIDRHGSRVTSVLVMAIQQRQRVTCKRDIAEVLPIGEKEKPPIPTRMRASEIIGGCLHSGEHISVAVCTYIWIEESAGRCN